MSIPRGASVGIYGRRNALPTHTSYDFIQVLSGYKITAAASRQGRTQRSSNVSLINIIINLIISIIINLPVYTSYDFTQVLSGYKITAAASRQGRTQRSSNVSLINIIINLIISIIINLYLSTPLMTSPKYCLGIKYPLLHLGKAGHRDLLM